MIDVDVFCPRAHSIARYSYYLLEVGPGIWLKADRCRLDS